MYQLKREKNSPMPRGPRAQIGAKVKGRHKVDHMLILQSGALSFHVHSF